MTALDVAVTAVVVSSPLGAIRWASAGLAVVVVDDVVTAVLVVLVVVIESLTLLVSAICVSAGMEIEHLIFTMILN